MPIYRHVVRLPYDSGLPGDVAVNVYHSISDDDVAALTFNGHLVTFYGTIDGILSGLLSDAPNAATITVYDLSDPPPRAPIGTTTFTLSTSVNTLPPEVAMCMSFQGLKVSGLTQRRRRGRVFLGPMANINDLTTGRPTAANVTTIAGAGDVLLTATLAAPGITWAVYSPTNNDAIPVADGWVDNEFDTLRERQLKANSRTLFS